MISSGLVKLVKDVRSYFESYELTSEVRLGWRQRPQQVNQGQGQANRVIFIPSELNGRGGEMTAARHINYNPRAIFDWNRHFTISVWAVDSSDLQNEEKQIEAAETLVEWTMRAVQRSQAANIEWGETQWTINPVELKFGVEVLLSAVMRHPIFDVDSDVGTPNGRVKRDPES